MISTLLDEIELVFEVMFVALPEMSLVLVVILVVLAFVAVST